MNARTSALALAVVAAGTAMGQATTNPASSGPSGKPVVRRDIEPNLRGWWNDAVFYQVFVRSFKDSAEGPLANDGVGDLQGLLDSLDYLNDGKPETTDDLGVTALWLMPVLQSPSYHGYDVVDYKKIDDEYGDNDLYMKLLAACHDRGVRVILDWVPNHCSWDHPWFQESASGPQSPKRDWFVWQPADPGWKGPWNQQVWHPWPESAGTAATSWYYGIFWKGMPDLNYRNEQVSAAMLDAISFWLTRGTDGLRIDAIRHLIEDGQQQESTPATHEWLRRFFTAYKAVAPDAFTVGEVWAPTDQVAPYIGDQMDSAFEFWTAGATLDAINEGKRAKLDAQWARNLASYPKGQYSTFLANHDQDRTMSRLGGGDKSTARSSPEAYAKAKLAAALLLTSPGIPFIYYGEEIGMVGVKPDEDIRTPMQWTSSARDAGFSSASPWRAPNRDATGKNVALQSQDAGSLLSHYRRFIRLRQAHAALRTGDMTILDAGHPSVYAFLRTSGDETIAVIANLSDRPIREYGIVLPANVAATKAKDALAGAGRSAPAAGRPWKPLSDLTPRLVHVVTLEK